jgi:hypothetical protein
MRSPAAAFGWEVGYRHRWVFMALPIYLLLLGLIKPVVAGPGPLDPGDGFAALGVVPFSAAFMYFVAVFSFGLNGDLAARQSIYPARLFTLPVTTAELARWPMAYGGAAMLLLYLVAAIAARSVLEVRLPMIWPGILAVDVLAWTQVLTWMPYGLRGIRVVLTVAVLITLDAIVITAIELRMSEASLIAFIAPQLPMAYFVACRVLARARRGEVPDWSWTRARAGGERLLKPFRSVAAAQLWFEWRRHGRSLPLLVAWVVPFELSVLFISGFGSQWFVFEVLSFLLLTPILMAAFAGATVSKANPFARDVYGVSPFNATKPITSAAMIGAKLRMALWSTLAAWIVLLVAMTIGFKWSGADSVLIAWAEQSVNKVGLSRVVVAAAIVLGGLICLTWTMLVQGLYIGLSGRQWLIRTVGIATLAALMAIGPVFEWIAQDVDVQRWLFDWWPLFPVALVALKMSAAIWTAIRLCRRAVISDRTIVIGAASWMIAVTVLYGALVWWVDTPLIPRYPLALVAILAVPLVRVSAAPLALDWNRHR